MMMTERLVVALLLLAVAVTAFTQQPSVIQYSSCMAKTTTTARLVTTTTTESSLQTTILPDETVDVLICGGGPTGLLSAVMMAQQFPNFQICLVDEQPLPPPPPDDPEAWSSTNLDRYYLLGLGGRGITSLQHFGMWEESILPYCAAVPGRKDWNGKGKNVKPMETFKTERKFTTQVLPRDKLVSAMHQHIVNGQHEKEFFSNLQLRYGCKVEPLRIDGKDDNSQVLVNVTTTSKSDSNDDSSKIMAASVVVAADGSARTFANEMQRMEEEAQRSSNSNADQFRVIRYPDDNQKVYKNIGFSIPTDWRKDINYAVRTDRIIFDALPANDRGDYVGILLLPKDDGMARDNIDPADFKAFLQDQIPQFVEFLDDRTIANVAKRSPSTLPMFRYVTPRMHYGDGRIVLLGDCAHTVKPYFGLGANSALEDVRLLSQSIDTARKRVKRKENDSDEDVAMLKASVRDFSAMRSPDIQTLVRVSHSLDRPGAEGIVTFLIPIILDGIFSKLLPQVFAPNVISMLQNEEITFQEAAKRKRLDRLGQVALLVAFGYLVSQISNFIGDLF